MTQHQLQYIIKIQKLIPLKAMKTLRQSVDHFAQFWIKVIFSLFQFASLGSLVSFIVTCAKHPGMTNLSLDNCTVKSQDVSSGRYELCLEKACVRHIRKSIVQISCMSVRAFFQQHCIFFCLDSIIYTSGILSLI